MVLSPSEVKMKPGGELFFLSLLLTLTTHLEQTFLIMSTTFSSSSRAPKAYSGPIPEYKLESPSSTSRSIRIADWKISSSTTHIMNAKQIDE